MPESGAIPAGADLVLFDGVCGLCNAFVRFVLKRDKGGRFYFAPLQGGLAARLLKKYGADPDLFDTVYVVANYDTTEQKLFSRARAALFVVSRLGWPWRGFSVLNVLPDFFLNFFYDLIARWRYRMFGKYDACPIPKPEERARFPE
jgi:predicted DCC family thiol-disulfide oxidoreductase YuxK